MQPGQGGGFMESLDGAKGSIGGGLLGEYRELYVQSAELCTVLSMRRALVQPGPHLLPLVFPPLRLPLIDQ